ncbi:RagB/SusD family nutrient uptake outer membrane protein [Puteibacter caeruleilacunae]|nr:RagB/SusD family nutrient uptake outer membrane protein [Puteibacter caeruleilacunae]
MKKFTIILLVLSITISSCSDFFDIDQPDIVEAEDNYQNSYDALVSIIGIYESLQKTVETQFLMGEVRSDLVIDNSNAPVELQEISRSVLKNSNEYLDATQFYKVINQVNDVFTHLDKVQENDPSVDETQRAKYEAELTYLRATTYLIMLRMYDEVVYFEEPIVNLDQTVEFTKMDKNAVLDTLITQVNKHKFTRDIVANSDAIWYRTRFTNYPPYQLAGELYLEKGDWVNAFANFMVVISDKAEEYVPGSVSADWAWSLDNTQFNDHKWSDMFGEALYGDGFTDEALVIYPFNKKYDQVHKLTYWTSTDDGAYYLKPTVKGISYWLSEDDHFRGEDNSYVETPQGPMINKYRINNTAYQYDNVYYMWRAGDSWLDAAEALNRSGDPKNALGMVNNGMFDDQVMVSSQGVRGRVDLLPYELDLPEDATKQDSIMAVDEFILQERARETAFEGNRFHDVARAAKWRNDPEFLAKIIASKFMIGSSDYNTLYNKLQDQNNWYVDFNTEDIDFVEVVNTSATFVDN